MAEELSKQDSFTRLANCKEVFCRYHKHETYQLYCRDCHDFVCFECLSAKHQNHSLCRLREAEKDICEDIRTFFTSETGIYERFELIMEKLSETILRLEKNENDLCVKIETTAKDMIDNIQMSKVQLLSSVTEIFSKYTKDIRLAQQKAESLRSLTGGFNTDILNEFDISHIAFLADLKECFVGGDTNFDEYKIPIFKPNPCHSVGRVCKQSNFEEQSDVCQCGRNNLSVEKINEFTQTHQDGPEDSDSDTEWYDADDSSMELGNENSSDEIEDVYPLHIKLEDSIKLVRKIIPLSDNDAWILGDRKLRKIVGCTIDDTVYAENVDDIAVLKNGSVLVLNKTADFIMRLLPDKRLVRFCNAKRGSVIPCCLDVTKDDSIIVYLYYDFNRDKSGNYLLKLNNSGVNTESNQFYTTHKTSPCIVLSNESNFCTLYMENAGEVAVLRTIKPTGEEISRFSGAFGFCKSRYFRCHGICIDNKGNVLVSDYFHHCVYTLDKSLKFQRCIVDASDGLNNPASIALFENRLWVSDGQQILIFKYDSS